MSKVRYQTIIIVIAIVVLLFAPSCEPPDNYAPVIDGLGAEASWVPPSGSIQVTCNASDRDDDILGYDWSASKGEITGTGSEVTWTAPGQLGICDITVLVNDGHGGNITGTLTLYAANGTMPIIENLVITAENPKYLREYSWGYKVGKEEVYYIECVSSNASGELVYHWLSDSGEITGEGSMITWTAPNTVVDVTIMVVVFDTAGYMDIEQLYLEVVSCSSCTFG